LPTARERQIKRALSGRDEQIERILREELAQLANDEDVRWRWWGTRGRGPLFIFTTTAVERGGERGWLSFVGSEDRGGTVSVPDIRSVELHRQRKAAKARAWNLYQGWRLARGMTTRWGTFA
jgi:hypothetical protein